MKASKPCIDLGEARVSLSPHTHAGRWLCLPERLEVSAQSHLTDEEALNHTEEISHSETDQTLEPSSLALLCVQG